MKRFKFNKYSCLVTCVALVTAVVFYGIWSNRHADRLAVKALKYLYEYSTAEQKLQDLNSLSKLCTKSVYKELTYPKQDKPAPYELIMSYKEKTKVKVLYKGNGYVIYSLESKVVNPDVQFIFAYNEFMGKITEVNNGEFDDFYMDYSDSDNK